MNALVLAARDGQWEVVDTLLLRGTQVDIVDSEQRTPLMMAASENHTNVVELLLDSGKIFIYFFFNIFNETLLSYNICCYVIKKWLGTF